MSGIKTQKRPIVVGVALSSQNAKFLKSCVSLAERLKAPLELVHAVEPSFNFMGPADVIVNPFYGYERALGEIEESQAREQLEAIKATFPPKLEVRLHVIRDEPAEALNAVAHEVRAGMIICGVESLAQRSLFSGISTAFSLAAHADVPVMLLPCQSILDFNIPSRLLIADNLEVEGRFALENALRMAEDLASPAIFHVHIHPRSAPEISSIAELVQEEMLRGRLPTDPQFTGSRYIEMIGQRIIDDLVYRFHNSEGAQQLAASYQPRVAFGKPSEELHKLINETQAHVLIFGRHHLIHRKSFTLGKVPYTAMIEDHTATVIVPDGDRHLLQRPR